MKRADKSSRLLASMLALFFLTQISCVPRQNKQDSGPENLNPKKTTKSHVAFELFDPEMAKVTVSAAKLEVRGFGGDFSLPTFGIQFNGNDYVQILRCQESYRSHLEYLISKAEQGSGDERKWVWSDSLGDPKVCKIASSRFNGQEYQDLGARNGSIFYLLNPCVSASISATGADACSFNFAVTNSITYTQAPSNLVLQKSSELADAESAYDAHISRLMGLSRDLMNKKSACEYGITHAHTRDNIRSFGWDLLAAGLAIGGFFAVRGLVNSGKLGSAAESLTTKNLKGTYKTLADKSAGFLNTLNNNKNSVVWATGGIFAAALTIRTLYSRFKSSDPKSKTVPACEEADQVAATILEIQEQRTLDTAMEEVIRISGEISAIDARFTGYNKSSFTIK